jgi:hypothetical protein
MPVPQLGRRLHGRTQNGAARGRFRKSGTFHTVMPSRRAPQQRFPIGESPSAQHRYPTIPPRADHHPSTSPRTGWSPRSHPAYLLALYPFHTASLRVLCWRDSDLPTPGKSWKFRFGFVSRSDSSDPAAEPTALGWERHSTTNKLSARMANPAPGPDEVSPTPLIRSCAS